MPSEIYYLFYRSTMRHDIEKIGRYEGKKRFKTPCEPVKIGIVKVCTSKYKSKDLPLIPVTPIVSQ